MINVHGYLYPFFFLIVNLLYYLICCFIITMCWKQHNNGMLSNNINPNSSKYIIHTTFCTYNYILSWYWDLPPAKIQLDCFVCRYKLTFPYTTHDHTWLLSMYILLCPVLLLWLIQPPSYLWVALINIFWEGASKVRGKFWHIHQQKLWNCIRERKAWHRIELQIDKWYNSLVRWTTYHY